MANHALIALEPKDEVESNLAHFYEIVRLFQDKGLFASTSVLSIIHPSLYLMPGAWFKDRKNKLIKDAYQDVGARLQGAFSYDSIKVLATMSDSLENLVSVISRFARRAGSDIVVIASNARTGLPLWFLGSLSETAAFIAPLPVLIIKPQVEVTAFAPVPRLTLGVDTSIPFPATALRWIARVAQSMGAELDLVHVKPRVHILDSIQPRARDKTPERILEDLGRKFLKAGTQVHIMIQEEGASVAQTLVDCAEQRQAWIVMTIAAKRSPIRKLLLGSNARRILALSRRPFLNVRLE